MCPPQRPRAHANGFNIFFPSPSPLCSPTDEPGNSRPSHISRIKQQIQVKSSGAGRPAADASPPAGSSPFSSTAELSLLCICQGNGANTLLIYTSSRLDPALYQCHPSEKGPHRGKRVCLGGDSPHKVTPVPSTSPPLPLQPLAGCSSSNLRASRAPHTRVGEQQTPNPPLKPRGRGGGGRGPLLHQPPVAPCLSFPIAPWSAPKLRAAAPAAHNLSPLNTNPFPRPCMTRGSLNGFTSPHPSSLHPPCTGQPLLVFC